MGEEDDLFSNSRIGGEGGAEGDSEISNSQFEIPNHPHLNPLPGYWERRPETDYAGILCIGDPHLCGWAPGYRKDDYPQIVLEKLQWSLQYARDHQLLPVLLGDLFHVPRDNSNWLMSRLMVMLDGPILAVIGNHDLSEDLLSDHDSLKVLLAAGRLRMLEENPWAGLINHIPVLIGGTNNGQPIPKSLDRSNYGYPRWAIWITHHDIQFPDYDAGYQSCREIPGIDLVINGHIHRQMVDVVNGQTTWCNPGNISRVNRGDATKLHEPGVLRIDVTAEKITRTRIAVPHKPFEDCFHSADSLVSPVEGRSQFITGLAAMQKFRTKDGEGLRRLVEENLPCISNEKTRTEIEKLLSEVLTHG
jgi:predicted phosphodiesterase